MDKEIKRISVNAIERIIEASTEPGLVEVNWHGETITVKCRLGLTDMMRFVDTVSNNSFLDDGTYYPEVEGFARRCAILEVYGNLRLPQNIEQRYKFVYSNVVSEAIDMILSNVDQNQYAEILDAIQDKIDYRVNTEMEKANRRVEEIARSLTDLENVFKDMFDGMSPDDVKSLIGALAHGVDEKKIVDAIMDKKEQQESDAVITDKADVNEEAQE